MRFVKNAGLFSNLTMRIRNIFQVSVTSPSKNLLSLLPTLHGHEQPLNLPRFEISKCKHSSKHWSYHKIAFNSQKAKIWTKVKSFDQFHEN